MRQRAGQATPTLFCREVLDSFWVCAKPGETHQDRTGDRGRNGSAPGVPGKMMSVPGTNKKNEI